MLEAAFKMGADGI
jgi:N,N'-diacetyllegionaminate synthase